MYVRLCIKLGMYGCIAGGKQLQPESLTTLDSPFAALFLNSAWGHSNICMFECMHIHTYIRESVNMYIWYFYWHMLANTNIFMYVHMYIRIYTYIHECWETSIWRNNSRAIDTCIPAASNRPLWFSCFMTVQAATYLKCLKQPLLLPFT